MESKINVPWNPLCYSYLYVIWMHNDHEIMKSVFMFKISLDVWFFFSKWIVLFLQVRWCCKINRCGLGWTNIKQTRVRASKKYLWSEVMVHTNDYCVFGPIRSELDLTNFLSKNIYTKWYIGIWIKTEEDFSLFDCSICWIAHLNTL